MVATAPLHTPCFGTPRENTQLEQAHIDPRQLGYVELTEKLQVQFGSGDPVAYM